MLAQQLVAPCHFESVDARLPEEETLPVGQAIVRTLASGVCGSDLPLFRGAAIPDTHVADEVRFGPRRLGFPNHEIVGTVIASNCSLQVGERVVGWAFRNSGLAECVIVEEQSVTPITSAADPVAQLTIQPLACAIHALGRVGEIAGKRAAVVGQGPIGLVFAEYLKAMGADHVTGIDRVDRATGSYQFGVDEKVIDSTDRWVHGIDASDRYDLIIEAIGHHNGPLNHAIQAAAEDGVIFAFGGIDEQTYSIEMRAVHRKQLSLISGTTPLHHRSPALEKAARYVESRPDFMSAYVTDVKGPEQTQTAFEDACNQEPGRIKVAVEWDAAKSARATTN